MVKKPEREIEREREREREIGMDSFLQLSANVLNVHFVYNIMLRHISPLPLSSLSVRDIMTL